MGFASVLTLILLLLAAHPAAAHGYIVRAIPEDRAELERAPTRVQYWFSEDLEPEFSRIELLDNTGEVIATGGVDEEDNSLMVLRPPSDLPDGAYIVSLRPAFASDGHVVAETRVFFVGESVGGVQGSAASDAAVPLEVVWRGIVLTASSLLLGVFVLYDKVLLPAWGSKKHIAGFLPPRVMNRLTLIAAIAFVVALVGNALALLQNAMVLFDAPLARVIDNNLWNTARISSRFGEVWNVRMLLLIVLGVLLVLTVVWRKDKPRTMAPFWRALMWGTALMVGTFAASSHATGALVMPWVAVLMHWLHMTAVAVWTGGLAALALVLPTALQPYEGEQRRLALLAAMRHFSPLALGAAAVTITTGVYNSLNWLFQPSDLGTTYGVHLIYKVLLVVGLLVVAAAHHIAANPERYDQWQGLAARFSGWRVTLPLEVGAAFLVLLAAGWVSATPPPTPEFVNAEVPAPLATQTVDEVTAQMNIAPGGLGVNTYDIRVSGVDAPQTVYVQVVRPEADRRGIWHEAEPVEAGLFVAAGDELDEEGRWLSLVDVGNGDGTFTRFAYEWDITNEATVIQSIPPRWQHWVALGAVLVALVYVVTPAYRAFMRRMNLNALTLSVIVLAVVGTAAIVILTAVYIQRVQQRTAFVLNPVPGIVNPILPDADSIEFGAQIFERNCEWDTDSSTFTSFVERLPRTDDEELYRFTLEGWRSLGPCRRDLDPERRWHLVNYLRTLELRG